MSDIFLGYEVGGGKPVSIPQRHLCVTGQTQEAGKTTALEAMISRSGLRAIAFITKRGEKSFESGRQILPYFRERVDWEFVESIIEAVMRQKMKFERAWIVRASKGARSLADVRRNVADASAKAKRSMDADIYMLLGEYLDKVVPLLARLPKCDEIHLETGLNVMDLRSYPEELQMLIISSSFRWIHEHEERVVSILPEAWKFAPQGRKTPVSLEVKKLAREGAGLKNYLWIDSQDIAGVEKEILRAAAVWLIGVQREANEIERALKSIPKGIKRPKEGDIPQLKLGEFFVCWGEHVKKVYVQPAWMLPADAIQIAVGKWSVEDFARPKPQKSEDDNLDYKTAYEEAMATVDQLKARIAKLEKGMQDAVEVPGVKSRSGPVAMAGNGESTEQEVAMALTYRKPVIDLTVRKYVIQASTEDPKGRVAFLLQEGFFAVPRKNTNVGEEMRSRGWLSKTANTKILNFPLSELTKLGFLRVVGQATYQAVPGMEVNIREVQEVA